MAVEYVYENGEWVPVLGGNPNAVKKPSVIANGQGLIWNGSTFVPQTLATTDMLDELREDIEEMHTGGRDTGWQSPSYASGWSDYAAPYGPVKYKRTRDGMVIIKGLCQAIVGASLGIFTLPPSFRPHKDQTLLFRLDLNGNWARVDIEGSTGNVFVNGWNLTANGAPYLSFETLTFVAES